MHTEIQNTHILQNNFPEPHRSRTNEIKDKTLRDGWREGRRMYLDPIYWIIDNSCLRLLEEEWRERNR